MKKVAISNSIAIFGRVLFYFVIWIVSIVAYITIFEVLIKNSLGKDDFGTAFVTFFAELVALFSILTTNFVMRKYTTNGKLNIYNFNTKLLLLAILIGLIWMGATVVGQLSTTTLYYKFGYNSVRPNTIFIFAQALLFNTIFQELLFRGFLFKILEEKANSLLAIILSSLLFLGFHAGAIQAGIIPAFNVFGAGLIFAILLYKTRSIIVPIIVHYMWNFGFVLLGLTAIPNYPSFNYFTLYGSNLLAGGSNGIEATITTTGVIIITIIILSRYLKKLV